MTTVYSVLAAAYPKHIDRIVEIGERSAMLDDKPWDCAGALLASLFLWAATEEGHAYWAELAMQQGWKG